jgi:predicted small lipoprotein YifL
MLRSAAGASRSTHRKDAAAATMRRFTPALILLLLVAALAGCGKKGNPLPPPDEPNTYPRSYPSE